MREVPFPEHAVYSPYPAFNRFLRNDMHAPEFLHDDDFLAGPDRARAAAAAALEAERAAAGTWAAGAVRNRHPGFAAWRGPKGLAACRQDMDFHLRHLHGALTAADAGSLDGYARWVMPVLAGRGVDVDAVAAGVTVLAEALHRFLPPASATLAARELLHAFAHIGIAAPGSPG